jgi:hypothetical protein
MNRQELIEQHTKKTLGLRLDTAAEKASATGVALFTAMLKPDSYERYVHEVEGPAVIKHMHSRGFRKLHDELRAGAQRILDEDMNALVERAQKLEVVS